MAGTKACAGGTVGSCAPPSTGGQEQAEAAPNAAPPSSASHCVRLTACFTLELVLRDRLGRAGNKPKSSDLFLHPTCEAAGGANPDGFR
jgi:hypothetical protein